MAANNLEAVEEYFNDSDQGSARRQGVIERRLGGSISAEEFDAATEAGIMVGLFSDMFSDGDEVEDHLREHAFGELGQDSESAKQLDRGFVGAIALSEISGKPLRVRMGLPNPEGTVVSIHLATEFVVVDFRLAASVVTDDLIDQLSEYAARKFLKAHRHNRGVDGLGTP